MPRLRRSIEDTRVQGVGAKKGRNYAKSMKMLNDGMESDSSWAKGKLADVFVRVREFTRQNVFRLLFSNDEYPSGSHSGTSCGVA